MFKIFNNDCLTYLREQFHRTSEIHDYNLRGSNYDLQLPLPKTNFLKSSFSYRGAMAWNQLSNVLAKSIVMAAVVSDPYNRNQSTPRDRFGPQA